MKTKIIILFLVITLAACAPAITPAPTETPIPTATFTPISPTTAPTLEVTLVPATVMPTQPPVPIITPDAIQVERWQEYEDALAKSILPMDTFESVLCEWDILGQSGQEVYVWAICASLKGDDMRPVVIHLGTDGSVRSVEILKRGSSPDIINRLFPEMVQVKFDLYAGDSRFSGRLREMLNNLEYRETHPEEPPLIVLLATPIPTPTP